MKDIAGLMGKRHQTVFEYARAHGGIAPAPMRRSARALSLAERESISRGLVGGWSIRKIASTINRSASTVSREVARHGGSEKYRAVEADARAQKSTQRPKPCVLGVRRKLRSIVAQKLSSNWSPEQIASWLKIRYPGNVEMHVSHETIYRTLFVQARGVLKKELIDHLRRVRVMRHPKKASDVHDPLRDAISIRERPAEAEDRAVPGHWEGDLICGSNNSYIVTLAERSSRFTMLIKVPSRDATTVSQAVSAKIKRLPAELKRSLTWDRGTEMTKHRDITIATAVPVYFCDPYKPWQRGTNENTNGLLRQYFPKGTDLSQYSQAYLNKVVLQLNTRPRKTLGFQTPAEYLEAVLH